MEARFIGRPSWTSCVILMGFQLVAMAALAGTGGTAVLEHPAAPPEPTAASIWRAPIMQMLLHLPECSFCTLAQGLWGAQTAKPTSLAILNAPGLLGELHKGRVTKEVPKGMSIGKEQSGQWATSKLKESPWGFVLPWRRDSCRPPLAQS